MTTDDGLPKVFRGPEAPFPIEDLSTFLTMTSYAHLFAEDITQPSGRLLKLLDRLSVDQANQIMTSFFGDSVDKIKFKSGVNLVSALNLKEGWAIYSSDFYFEIGDGDAFGYSSARDNLSVIAVRLRLLRDPSQEIELWDRAFGRYLRESSIGFGEEGRVYARALLAQLPVPRSKTLLASVGG